MTFPSTRWFRELLLVGIYMLGILGIVASGSSGGGSDDDLDSDNDTSTPGVDLGLKLDQGDFWELYWFNDTTTFSQGSGASSNSDFGIFRVTLDAPVMTVGLEAYPLIVDGDAGPYLPRWTHVALDADGSLLGSTDGVNFELVFDITSGEWNGGGFFHDFEDDPVTIDPATLVGEYNTVSALRLGYNASDGGCETILGFTLCDDTSTTFSFYEYHKEGIGPVGFRQDTTYSSSGGNFFTSTTIKNTVELIETSETATDMTVFNRPDWEEVAPLATARDSHGAAVINGKIYAVGGFDSNSNSLSSMEVYDPVADDWILGPSAPTTVTGPAHAIGGKLYVESVNANQVHIYDPASGWSTLTVSSTGGSFGSLGWSDTYNDTTFGFGEIILGVEGATPGNNVIIAGYDPPSTSFPGGRWLFGSNPLSIIEWLRPAVAIVGDSMYVLGGFGRNTSCDFFSCDRGARDWVYEYDILNDTFSNFGAVDMSTKRDNLAAVAFNGNVIALGGNPVSCSSSGNCNIGSPMRSAESYNPIANTWTDISSMLNPRQDFVAVVLNGDLYVIGGDNGSNETASVERYRP